MQQFRVQLIRTVETECAVAVYADTPEDAKRLAQYLAPEDGRAWLTVNSETTATAEPQEGG